MGLQVNDMRAALENIMKLKIETKRELTQITGRLLNRPCDISIRTMVVVSG